MFSKNIKTRLEIGKRSTLEIKIIMYTYSGIATEIHTYYMLLIMVLIINSHLYRAHSFFSCSYPFSLLLLGLTAIDTQQKSNNDSVPIELFTPVNLVQYSVNPLFLCQKLALCEFPRCCPDFDINDSICKEVFNHFASYPSQLLSCFDHRMNNIKQTKATNNDQVFTNFYSLRVRSPFNSCSTSLVRSSPYFFWNSSRTVFFRIHPCK